MINKQRSLNWRQKSGDVRFELGNNKRAQLVRYILKIEENKVQEFWSSTPENAECLQSVPISLQSVIILFVYTFITNHLFLAMNFVRSNNSYTPNGGNSVV